MSISVETGLLTLRPTHFITQDQENVIFGLVFSKHEMRSDTISHESEYKKKSLNALFCGLKMVWFAAGVEICWNVEKISREDLLFLWNIFKKCSVFWDYFLMTMNTIIDTFG